jgi:hypothetical protein
MFPKGILPGLAALPVEPHQDRLPRWQVSV